MHELGIAQSILGIVEEAVPDPGDRARLKSVRVRVGRLSGVLADSLDFCFTALVDGTALSAARLAIEDVPARITCRSCSAEAEVEDLVFACPSCGGTQVKLVQGMELAVVELELAEGVS